VPRVLLVHQASSDGGLLGRCHETFPGCLDCGPDAAIDEVQRNKVQLVLILGTSGTMQIERLTSSLRSLTEPPHIVWIGASEARVDQAARFGPDDAIGLSQVTTQLPLVMSRAQGQARVGDEWSGRSFLERVDGSLERFPPLRVLFLAHRLAASGVLEVQVDGQDVGIFIQGGTVVGCRGLPSLLADLGIDGDLSTGLDDLVGQVIAAGMAPDTAFRVAAKALGQTIAGWWPAGEGRVLFDPLALSPVHPLSLGQVPTRLIAAGLQAERPAEIARASLAGHAGDRVFLQVPDDSPDARWGLDAVCLRLMRRCRPGITLERLLGSSGDDDVLAFDLLRALGMVRLMAPLAPAASFPVVDEALVADEDVQELRAELTALEAASYLDVLGVTSADDLTEDGVERLFRRRSVDFHPDRHLNGSAARQALANACFQRVVEARDSFRDPAVRGEAQRRMSALQRGEVYVSPADRRRALMLFAQGDVHFKRRRWADARRAIDEGLRLDPAHWRPKFLLLQCDWREESRPLAQIAKDLEALQVANGAAQAEVFYIAGEIRLADGNEGEATKLFKRAVDAQPEHVAARRRLRLSDLRDGKSLPPTQPAATTAAGGEAASFLDNLFRRKP
jgi:tetratricopeptide (TPR) repeat protein